MKRIGLFAGYSLHYEYIQANILIHGHYHFNRLTKKPKGWECQLKTALLVAFGDKTNRNQPFFETLVNYTGRPYYIGYAYHLYFDTQQTSQRTGEVGLGIHGFGFRFENDFLAFESRAYRTGGFQLSYQWNDVYTLFKIYNGLMIRILKGAKQCDDTILVLTDIDL